VEAMEMEMMEEIPFLSLPLLLLLLLPHVVPPSTDASSISTPQL
jgi:hypothetical protein